MNKLLLLILISFSSCSTYHYYSTTEITNIYADEQSAQPQGTLPIGEIIAVKGKAKKRNRIRFFTNSQAWASVSRCSYIGKKVPANYTTSSSPSRPSTAPSAGSSYTPSSGGQVQVKGYYRKDGTYVRPHTRSAPRRRG